VVTQSCLADKTVVSFSDRTVLSRKPMRLCLQRASRNSPLTPAELKHAPCWDALEGSACALYLRRCLCTLLFSPLLVHSSLLSSPRSLCLGAIHGQL
jgi:hypothetical protein